MSKRPVRLQDKFQITCKKCGSTDVDLYPENCGICGVIIDAHCNSCKEDYKKHDFEWVEEEA